MDWVRPVCHELGNLLAGIQLSGHFLGDPLADRDRHQIAHEVQLLSAQAGAWVSLIRPLRMQKLLLGRVAPSELLAALRRRVDELLFRPEQLKALKGHRLSDVRVDVDAVHQLLTLLVGSALANGGAEIRMKLEAREQARHLVLIFSDSGPPLAPLGPTPAPRGRELALQVGNVVLRAAGGRLEVLPRKRGNRVELYLPRVSRRLPRGGAAAR
ncbi:MAG: HAMP domain-containing histidine kinase [Deltaproteobacteria bacterium]|nr:HAMP domain-containing histidine kinase [Deltaproteobacteria bacterium]MBW2394914.1 HAMP domain-containing histidine kinase [Deltaproteobacteria bacterium]